MKKYVCGICGSEYTNLDGYMNCVAACGKKAKESKHMEEVNAGLNKIKAAKEYYEQQLEAFKEKFPKEYELNFGNKKAESKVDTKSNKSNTEVPSFHKVEVKMSDDGKGKPVIDAKVNGKKVDDESLEKLFEDPDTKYLAKLLGIM